LSTHDREHGSDQAERPREIRLEVAGELLIG